MAINLSSLQKGNASAPPRIVLYGVEGVGKTTLAANAPNPVAILTEDGLGSLETAHFPLAKHYNEVLEALASLAQEQHEFKTLIVDSLDWLEPLIWQKTAQDHGNANIEDFGYGKGYVLAIDAWSDFFTALDYLRNEKGMAIILTAHSEVKSFNDPTNEPYDRYQIKLQKLAAAKVREWGDCILFANYRVATKADQVGSDKNNKKTRAIGSGERLIFTEERPAFQAKNRFSMPNQLPLEWAALAQAIPYYSKGAKDNG